MNELIAFLYFLCVGIVIGFVLSVVIFKEKE
jgi:hypothetical protein